MSSMSKLSKVVLLTQATQYKDPEVLLESAPTENQTTALVFAANVKVNDPDKTLFDRYTTKAITPTTDQEKLANLASDAGLGSIGLPFHGMDEVKDATKIPVEARTAVAKMYMAAGRGIKLVAAFDITQWQGNDMLRDWYLKQLNMLQKLLATKAQGKILISKFEYQDGVAKVKIDDEFQKAYRAGYSASQEWELIDVVAGSEAETKPKTRHANTLYVIRDDKADTVSYFTKNMKTVAVVNRNDLNTFGLKDTGDLTAIDSKNLKGAVMAYAHKQNDLTKTDHSYVAPRASRAVAANSPEPAVKERMKQVNAEADRRFWDRLKLAASLLLGIIGIIPVYLFWYKGRRAEEKNVEVSITPANMAILNEYRRQLTAKAKGNPNLDISAGADRPHKLMGKFVSPEQTTTVIMDRDQKIRHDMWSKMKKDGVTELTTDTARDLRQSVIASVTAMKPAGAP